MKARRMTCFTSIHYTRLRARCYNASAALAGELAVPPHGRKVGRLQPASAGVTAFHEVRSLDEARGYVALKGASRARWTR